MDEIKRGYLYARAMHTSVLHKFSFFAFIREAEYIMARFLHHELFCAQRKIYGLFLALLWTLGLSFGIWASAFAGTLQTSLMRGTVSGAVSIASLLCVTGLPFLLSAFAVFISCPWLILLLAFVKGACFSFVSMGLILTFGSAGWLIRLLLCFADAASIPLLYWFWICCFRTGNCLHGYHLILIAALLLLLGSIDYCLISPYLANLIIM